MSNTNLTGTELNCSEVKPEDNKLKGKKPGNATKANKLGQTNIEQGVESLTIIVMPYTINLDGERVDRQGKKSKATKPSTEIKEEYTKWKKFNQARLEEMKQNSTKQSENQIEL